MSDHQTTYQIKGANMQGVIQAGVIHNVNQTFYASEPPSRPDLSLPGSDDTTYNPDVFILQEEKQILIKLLEKFLLKFPETKDRNDFLDNSGIDDSVVRSVFRNFENSFTSKCTAFRVSMKRPDYHPLICFLKSLVQNSISKILTDDEVKFCQYIIGRGEENCRILKARSAVCRIESPVKTPIGTGVYLGKQFMLTCGHVLKPHQNAWARFGYYDKDRLRDYDLFEIDMTPVFVSSDPDAALVRLNTEPPYVLPAAVFTGTVSSSPDAAVRMIHHFRGGPMAISKPGRISRVDETELIHTIPAEKCSSGAPIFNSKWELTAIYRGVNPEVLPEAVPIHGILPHIRSFIIDA